MKIEQLSPKPDDKIQFKLSFYKNAPKTSGCYVLATFEDDILYIGLSDNLYKRFQQHLENPNKTQSTPEGKAVWFYYIRYNINNLPKLERTWLNQFEAIQGKLPILNKISSPIG
jgi:hypothetical protein